MPCARPARFCPPDIEAADLVLPSFAALDYLLALKFIPVKLIASGPTCTGDQLLKAHLCFAITSPDKILVLE